MSAGNSTVYLERLLQINIATMAALGTLLFGMGQRDLWLPVVVGIVAVLSVWLTDVAGWLRLSRGVVNLLAVGAFFVFLWQASALRGLVQVLAIGYFLVYLEIIFLLQKKEPRTYAWLALLSLVQVVVAAVFYQKATFGVLLLFYLFIGLSALVLLFLHAERTRHRPASSRLPAPVSAGRRWPLADQKPAFTDATAAVAGQGGITRELPVRVVKMGFGTLVLTLLIFFVVPRRGLQDIWRGALASMPRSVGFSDTVTLGELGQIIENPEEVLRIQFFDGPGGSPYRVTGEVYLHGTVLTRYEQGAWGYHPIPAMRSVRQLPPSTAAADPALVRQRITIEPMDQDTLFCVRPFVNTRREREPKLYFDSERQTLFRPHDQMSRRFVYELGTTALAGRFQSALVPVSDEEQVDTELLLDGPPADGPGKMPELVALADAWVQESELEPDDRLACARLLERQLRDSGRFEYSLEGQARDPEIDPVEDFIANNPRGHCEYFATALALMLRSQGIPARMVVGFKTDEWNDLGGFFQVRQLHAHTWVEVYLEQRHYRDRPEGNDSRLEGAAGAWLRLDATPGGDAAGIHPLLDMIGGSFDWLDFLWANYVMDMDRDRQEKIVYDPLANIAVAMAVVLVLFVLLLAYQAFRSLPRRRLRRAGQADRRGRRARTVVDFYRRLEALLARLGLTRLPSQTQREFARQAGAKIAALTGQRDLAELPGEVVEAFYRVRFGSMSLDKPQAETVERALAQLKKTVASRQ